MWKSCLKLIIPMLIFGSIGIFVRGISLSTVELVFYRVFIASIFFSLLMLLKKKNPFRCGKRALCLAAVSGVIMGINWLLFFQALRCTTVAIGTMTYYLAPVLVLFAAPFVLGEHLSKKQVVTALLAPAGLALIVFSSGEAPLTVYHHGLGLLCGAGSALFYAMLILCNKKLDNIDNMDRTLIQLLAAALVLSPVLLKHHNFSVVKANLPLLLILGIVHTGIACYLYFSGLKETPTHLTAVLSYMDPVSAIFFAAAFLGEPVSPVQLGGTAVVLASAYLSGKSQTGAGSPGCGKVDEVN